jgi:hypothetical protein
MHVVTPIAPDALRAIYEANGWRCVGETEFFFAMERIGVTDEPIFIPRRGALVPFETMEQANAQLGDALFQGMTPAVLDEAMQLFGADDSDD